MNTIIVTFIVIESLLIAFFIAMVIIAKYIIRKNMREIKKIEREIIANERLIKYYKEEKLKALKIIKELT